MTSNHVKLVENNLIFMKNNIIIIIQHLIISIIVIVFDKQLIYKSHVYYSYAKGTHRYLKIQIIVVHAGCQTRIMNNDNFNQNVHNI